MEERIKKLITELEEEKINVTKDWESGYNNGLAYAIEKIIHRLVYYEVNPNCLETFYKYCKNNEYIGTLKFNSVIGELYIQMRFGKVIVDYKTSIDAFENDLINVLTDIQKRMKIAIYSSGVREEDIDLKL